MNSYQVIVKIDNNNEPITLTLEADKVLLRDGGVYTFINNNLPQPVACFSVKNIIGIINISSLNYDNTSNSLRVNENNNVNE